MMKVYVKGGSKNLFGVSYPVVIETNLTWAIPYWTARKKQNPQIYWEMLQLLVLVQAEKKQVLPYCQIY